MPGYSCSIKERMLYSSCKAPLLDLIQSLGVVIIKKVSTLISYLEYLV
jgi:twinfilin-like protein